MLGQGSTAPVPAFPCFPLILPIFQAHSFVQSLSGHSI